MIAQNTHGSTKNTWKMWDINPGCLDLETIFLKLYCVTSQKKKNITRETIKSTVLI